VSVQTVLNQICTYLGGPYDASQRIYATPGAPIVAGLYTVSRAWWKDDDHAMYRYGATSVVLSGSRMIVQIPGGEEHRVAVAGATSGMKKVAHDVQLHTYIRSEEPYAEDSQDFGYALKDAIYARLRADRTCGSGGLENGANGGFQVGEGGQPWFRWAMGQARVSAGLTKVYLRIECEAHEYIFA
jgi:hypothetical protein